MVVVWVAWWRILNKEISFGDLGCDTPVKKNQISDNVWFHGKLLQYDDTSYVVETSFIYNKLDITHVESLRLSLALPKPSVSRGE
jgi:hypothetical protein